MGDAILQEPKILIGRGEKIVEQWLVPCHIEPTQSNASLTGATDWLAQPIPMWHAYQWMGRIDRWSHMNRLSLRNDWFKFKTSGKLPIHWDHFTLKNLKLR
jgi:hypothetical protein